LSLIRQAAISEGHLVGPIVTLSYKNHTLDEILLDVVNHPMGLLSSPRALIRCGNAEDQQLKQYTEQHNAAEKSAQVKEIYAIARCYSILINLRLFHLSYTARTGCSIGETGLASPY
jgi:hypothetical protein